MCIRAAVFCFGCFLCLYAAVPGANAAGLPVQGRSSCRDDIVDTDEYKVRSVNFSSRYAPAGVLAQKTPAAGTPYTTALASQLIDALHSALDFEAVRDSNAGTEFQLLNSISPNKGTQVGFNYVNACVREVPEADCRGAAGVGSAKCVDIEIAAYAVRLNTADLWSNLLDNTRSNVPSFLSRVPGPLLALNPEGGVGYDRRYGASGSLGLRSNLLDLTKNLNNRVLTPNATRLTVDAQVRKSLQDSFYNTATGIALSHQFAKTIETLSARADVAADHTPLGSGDYLRNSASAGMDIKLRTGAEAFSALTFGVGYVRSGNRLGETATAAPTSTDENSVAFRAISDGKWLGGFSRLGVWADDSSPDSLFGKYHRVAALVGYARDFPVAPHQAVSVEVLSGGGGIWGEAPAYDRFFGGNSTSNFLYEPSDSLSSAAFLSGPLLRSLGNGQAATASTSVLQGGSSHWHINVNLALPIPRWSRPLIPDIMIDGIPKADENCKRVFDADGNPIIDERTLGEILKSQGSCAKNTLALNYKMQGLSASDAATKAAKDLSGVNSILEFLADRANLISVKPLLMFDAAGIYRSGIPDEHPRYGIGGGVQLTVVIARVEVGYMAGLHRFPTDPPGNFIMRLVFQNLF